MALNMLINQKEGQLYQQRSELEGHRPPDPRNGAPPWRAGQCRFPVSPKVGTVLQKQKKFPVFK